MKAAARPAAPSALTTGTALRFVILLGIVSLLADTIYEGARSVTGPYLGILGASGTIVGIVAGLGELIGYGLRLGSGYISDRTGRWETAAILVIAERPGRFSATQRRSTSFTAFSRRSPLCAAEYLRPSERILAYGPWSPVVADHRAAPACGGPCHFR